MPNKVWGSVQENFMKFFIIALHIFGIGALIFLIFLLLVDAKWEAPRWPDLSTAPCMHERNVSVVFGPVHLPNPAGNG